EADAVDPDVVVDAVLGNPRNVLDELIVGLRGVEAREQPDRDRERRERGREADRAPGGIGKASRAERARGGARGEQRESGEQGQERDDREELPPHRYLSRYQRIAAVPASIEAT